MKERKTVLIVDDEPDIREIEQVLLKHDFDIVGTAHDGREAIDIAERHKPDLIVLDYGLPDLDGLAVGTWIRATSGDSKILVFSGLAEAEEVLDPEWADAFLKKTDIVELPRVAEDLVTDELDANE